MKKLDIIYNCSLKLVQGINYVNNSFVLGQKYFRENGIILQNIYSPDGTFDCVSNKSLTLIGCDINTKKYHWIRKIRVFLKKMFPSQTLLGSFVKLYFNMIYPAKKALSYYESSVGYTSDYILFQDFFSAYFYYKKNRKKRLAKTILLLHSGENPLEQFMPVFSGLFRYKWVGNRIFGMLYYAMKKCNKVVYLSDNATSHSILPIDHKTYIFNGIEDVLNYKFVGLHSPLEFVIVASVIERKGQYILLEALKLLPLSIRKVVRINIVGNGDNLDSCKKFAVENNLDSVVKFWGNRNDVAKVLEQMDIFILPSLSEGMPMSIIEAMRQGLYIMATPVGGIPEMLRSQFGEFIQRDAQAIANSIEQLILNNVVTIEAKRAARKHYLENFTLKKMIDSYSNVFINL